MNPAASWTPVASSEHPIAQADRPRRRHSETTRASRSALVRRPAVVVEEQEPGIGHGARANRARRRRCRRGRRVDGQVGRCELGLASDGAAVGAGADETPIAVVLVSGAEQATISATAIASAPRTATNCRPYVGLEESHSSADHGREHGRSTKTLPSPARSERGFNDQSAGAIRPVPVDHWTAWAAARMSAPIACGMPSA